MSDYPNIPSKYDYGDDLAIDRSDDATVWDEGPCPTCKGKGRVNPLTAPIWFFCLAGEDCPTCDGSGECP